MLAGDFHIVLLKSNGKAVAYGSNDAGQCDIPPLPARLRYTRIAAGPFSTTLLRSDGAAVASGLHAMVPDLPAGLSYIPFNAGCSTIVQASFTDGSCVLAHLSGDPICQFTFAPEISAAEFQEQLLAKLSWEMSCVHVVMPSGALLSAAVLRDPSAALRRLL